MSNFDNYYRSGLKLKVSVKMGTHFPGKCAKTARAVLQDEPLGTLHRIQRIYYFPADPAEMESGRAEQTLGFPRQGAG